MAFHHDIKSESYFSIKPRHLKPNGRKRGHAELVAMLKQMSDEGIPDNTRYKSEEDGIEALSKTALNLDLFYVCKTTPLGYFTL